MTMIKKVDVVLTNNCNLRCSHCMVYQGSKIPPIIEPSKKKVIETFATLANHGVRTVNLWGGEVHLRQDFYEVLRPALDIFPRVSVQTNGSVETYLGIIHSDYPHLGVHVSLEGWGKHDEIIRGAGHFLRAKRNIEVLAKQMGQDLTIRTTIFNGNNINPLLEFALEKGCGWVGVRFKPLGRGNKLHKLQPSQERLAGLYQLIATLRKSYESQFMLEETPFYLYDEVLSQKYQAYFLQKGFACEWGHRIVVDVDGSIYPCPFGITDSLRLGSIYKDDMDTIEENYKELIKQRKNTDLIHHCSTCPLRDVCGGGCSILSFFNEDNKLGDPLCPIPLLLRGDEK